MRKMICFVVLMASTAGLAEARSARYQSMVNKLSKLDPAKDEDLMDASEIVSQVDSEVSKFSKRKTWNESDFADLVTLAAYASPFMSFPETAEILTSITRNGPKLAAAFERGLNGVDECRRQQLLFISKDAKGPYEGRKAEKNTLAKQSDFDYAKCVAAKK